MMQKIGAAYDRLTKDDTSEDDESYYDDATFAFSIFEELFGGGFRSYGGPGGPFSSRFAGAGGPGMEDFEFMGASAAMSTSARSGDRFSSFAARSVLLKRCFSGLVVLKCVQTN